MTVKELEKELRESRSEIKEHREMLQRSRKDEASQKEELKQHEFRHAIMANLLESIRLQIEVAAAYFPLGVKK